SCERQGQVQAGKARVDSFAKCDDLTRPIEKRGSRTPGCIDHIVVNPSFRKRCHSDFCNHGLDETSLGKDSLADRLSRVVKTVDNLPHHEETSHDSCSSGHGGLCGCTEKTIHGNRGGDPG